MSKTQKSASRSCTPSRSRSGSRSSTRSPSRSRSSSHSRSRKRRYSSRSHSRSRSHSPAHTRERNYPREYQNNREFRGYHRGFRRPYYYRGRGRGFFRGRFQRGRGGGYNNYRPNNWQNFRQHPQQQQQQKQHYPHNPKRGRSRSHSPKKCTDSPRSHSLSHHSDRSSSGPSQHSHPSTPPPTSPPKQSSGSGAVNDSSNVRERPKETQNGAGENGLPLCARGSVEGEGGSGVDAWHVQTDGNPGNPGPKRPSPQVRLAAAAGQGGSATTEKSPSPKSTHVVDNGTTSWQTVATASSGKSPVKKSPTPVFGANSKVDEAGEKSAITAAFKKFLEERRNKNLVSAWAENGMDSETKNDDMPQKKEPGKASGGIFDNGSAVGGAKSADRNTRSEREKYMYADNCEGNRQFSSFKRGPPFLRGDEDEEEDEEVELRPKAVEQGNDAPQWKSRTPLSAYEQFEARFGKLEDVAWDDELEALLCKSKQERAAAIMAVLEKRELAAMLKDLSPGKPLKVKRREKIPLVSSSTPPSLPRRSSEDPEPELARMMGDESPHRASGKRGTEGKFRMDPQSHDMARSSVLDDEGRFPRALVTADKTEQEFCSIFQDIQAPQLRRSPSELFAQHIVSIVHRIKAQHFRSSGMTLNDRFAMYQRRAAEQELAKPRRSPEIHRRIDVSPSAFKKHSHVFEEMKNSVDGSYKAEGKKMKSASVDLRQDIERRKKVSNRKGDNKQDWARDSEESNREQSTEKSSKSHKKLKKSKRKRERSHSSSSSSSSSSSHSHDEEEPRDEAVIRARLGPRDGGESLARGRGRGGFQFRIRGRSWSRGNYPGNNSNGKVSNLSMPAPQKNEDWDPEYIPKSRKYYLHDDREGEGDRGWPDGRGRGRGGHSYGRGRFILRRGNSDTKANNSSPKWTHDKFQGSGHGAELLDEDTDQDHKDEDNTVVTVNLEQ